MDPQESKTEIATKWYLKTPLVRALAQLIPYAGGAIDSYVATRYDALLEGRRRAFFEELDGEDRQLSPELIDSDDFLHCFDVTLRAVHRTHRAEKIRLFAKLFASAQARAAITVDEYEELLRVLDELSIRDLKVLVALEEYERRYYQNGGFESKEGANRSEGKFHSIAAQTLGVPPDKLSDDELMGIVIRLNRTGCYALMGWRKGPAHDCRLTGIYWRLREYVDLSSEVVD